MEGSVDVRSGWADPGPASTGRLLEALDRSGAREATWGELVDRHQRRLVLFAAARMSQAMRARIEPEDVINEAWMRAFADREIFRHRGRRSFYRWMCLQITRVIHDQARSAERQRQRAALRPLDVEPRQGGPGPITEVVGRERWEWVVGALETLADTYRIPLEQVYLALVPRHAVAAALALRPNTLTKRLHRGLQAWRAALGGQDPLEAL